MLVVVSLDLRLTTVSRTIIREKVSGQVILIALESMLAQDSMVFCCQELRASFPFGCSNNAGVMMCPFSKTKDGHEMQFGTNHLGQQVPFQLLSMHVCLFVAKVQSSMCACLLRPHRATDVVANNSIDSTTNCFKDTPMTFLPYLHGTALDYVEAPSISNI